MAQCTAPVRGHRSAASAAACPVCGRQSNYHQFRYNSYPSFPSVGSYASRSSSPSETMVRKKKAKWSPVESTILYTSTQIATLTPVRRNIINQRVSKYDLFLCHAWDDRRGVAKELYDKLTAGGLSVWFSENNLPLGSTMLREIDKGLEGVAEKELSALLAKDRLVPIVHNTTYDTLREVSPLLGSRSGLDTNEDSMDEIVAKLAELFVEEAN